MSYSNDAIVALSPEEREFARSSLYEKSKINDHHYHDNPRNTWLSYYFCPMSIPIIAPHHLKSRDVTKKDLKRLLDDAYHLARLCHVQHGNYPGGYAVAHCQITDKDPLRFFVMYDGLIVINPIITRHSGYKTKKKEGCLSYPVMPEVYVDRWNKCEVEFYTIDQETKSMIGPINLKLTDKKSQVFQHEMDHFNGVDIYS